MTDDLNPPAEPAREQEEREELSYRRRINKAIGRIHWQIKNELMSKGEVAELRRLSRASTRGRGSAFWRIVVQDLEKHRLLCGDVTWKHDCWSTILQGLATVAELHSPRVSLGRAIDAAEISEARLTRLLRARGDGLHSLIRPLAHQLRSRAQTVNWGDVAWLLLSERSADADRCRQSIANDYYRSEYKKTKANESNS